MKVKDNFQIEPRNYGPANHYINKQPQLVHKNGLGKLDTYDKAINNLDRKFNQYNQRPIITKNPNYLFSEKDNIFDMPEYNNNNKITGNKNHTMNNSNINLNKNKQRNLSYTLMRDTNNNGLNTKRSELENLKKQTQPSQPNMAKQPPVDQNKNCKRPNTNVIKLNGDFGERKASLKNCAGNRPNTEQVNTAVCGFEKNKENIPQPNRKPLNQLLAGSDKNQIRKKGKFGNELDQGLMKQTRPCFRRIFEFLFENWHDWSNLALVNRFFNNLMTKDQPIWHAIHKRIAIIPRELQNIDDCEISQGKQQKISKYKDLYNQDVDALIKKEGPESLKKLIIELTIQKHILKLNEFLNKITPLYEYNSAQLNLPNKIFEWLSIELNYTITNENNQILIQSKNFPYRIKVENYVTFLYGKLKNVKDFTLDDFDTLNINQQFHSKKLGKSIDIPTTIKKKELLENCNKTKVFNFFQKTNLALVFFEDDDNLLYGILEISASDIIERFVNLAKLIKGSFTKSIDCKKAEEKYSTNYERQLNLIQNYTSLQDYLTAQVDFEVRVSVHNGRDGLQYFIDTKSVGVVEGCKERGYLKSERLVFKFEDLHEPLECDQLFLRLDNEMGIAEKIENLCFCEVVVKDHERSLLVDSGVRFIKNDVNVFRKDQNLEYNSDNAEFFEISAAEPFYEYIMLVVKEKGNDNQPRIYLKELEIAIEKDFVINKKL